MPRRKLSQLREWDRNYNQGDVGAIATSIATFGYNRNIAEWRDGVIIAGNHTLRALKFLRQQGSEPPVNVGVDDDDWVIDTQDASHLDKDAATAYAIADNRTTQLAEPDDAQLSALLQEVADYDTELFAATGYDDDDLDTLLRDLNGDDAGDDSGPQVDRAEELNEKWGVAHGDLWVIPSANGGAHRLLCGDATSEDDVGRLLNGCSIALTLTDPPYGINVVKINRPADGGSKPVTIGSVCSRKPYAFGGVKNHGRRGSDGATNKVDASLYRPVHGDDKPFEPEWLLKMGKHQIIFGGNYFASKLPDSRCWIVWDKNNTGNFADAELAWTSFERGVRLYQFTWNGLVREGDRGIEGVKRIHPTQKPVGLFTMILNDFSERHDTIFDPYLGSGTTLIACQQSDRVGVGVEIVPEYCAVILERMAGMGLEPERVDA